MIRVLLVDDDYAQRAYLRNIISWEDMGYCIAGEAADGYEALKYIRAKSPDLIFLDVTMPGMSGIDFLRNVSDLLNNFKIVIVSGYDQFDFARQAMEFGVKHYLLKPVDEDELMDVLCKVEHEIESDREKRFELSRLYEKLSKSMPILREKFLLDLVSDRIDCKGSILSEKLNFLDMSLEGDSYMCAVVEMDDLHHSLQNEKNRQALKLAIIDVCIDMLQNCRSFEVFNDESDKVCIILEVSDDNRNIWIPHLDEVRVKVRDTLGINITIGCGGCYSLNEIFKSYNEALYILKSKTFLNSNHILDYYECETMEESYISLTSKYRDQMLIYIRHREPDKLVELVNEILLSYRSRKTTIDYMRIVSLEIITVGITYLATLGHSPSEIHGEGYNPLEQIMNCNSFDGLKKYVHIFFSSIFDFTSKLDTPKLSEIVLKARQYIEANYMNPGLSLEGIAAELFVHPVYLSSVFKKEMQKNFTGYLMETRMKKALDMLETSDVQISTVAASSGYEDQYYFSKVFKKYYGITPSEIRKSHI